MVTAVPYLPEVGETLVIVGAGTVNGTPSLACPLTVTTTLPVTAAGTVTPMLPAAQDVTLAVVPAKVTVLEPCGLPKLLPVIVTAVPGVPDVKLRLEMLGGGMIAGATIVESKLPFNVPSTSTFPCKELVLFVAV